MKKLYYLFTLLAFSIFIFTGCGKDDEETTPATGSIQANVSPAGAATNMRLTQGSTTLEIAPNSSGNFQADNIANGDYSVTFTPAMGFQAPAARNITITGGSTTDLGTVSFTQPGGLLIGIMSATINGNPWNSVIHGATATSTGLTITGSAINTTGSAEAIVLNLTNATGTGTFTAPDAQGVYTVASLMGAQLTWGSGGPMANCTVRITQFDQVNQKISGTFNFMAYAAPGSTASGTKTITNGTFTNLNIQ